jgi:hypothetical protein
MTCKTDLADRCPGQLLEDEELAALGGSAQRIVARTKLDDANFGSCHRLTLNAGSRSRQKGNPGIFLHGRQTMCLGLC